MQAMKDEIVRILDFSDLERKITEHTNNAWSKKLQQKN